MSHLVRLFGPPGTDEANYSDHKFSRHEDGSFWVIPEAVDGLTRVGGFTIAPAVDRTVTVSATRLAELEAEEATLLRAEPTAPPTMTRLTIPT